MGAGASGQAPVVVPPQPAAWSYGHSMPAEPRNDVDYGRQWHDENDWVPSQTSYGPRATHPDVVTSPTSSECARHHSDGTNSVATSAEQRNEYYPDLISGGQDADDTDAEIAPDLRVNLPPDGYNTFAICDTSKDDILTKIWSAEEYLGQLDEGDERIGKLSAAEEREMHFPRIKELLAIRGHLQDELLRIHDMIAEVDSDMSGLEDFVGTNTKIVQKLWDLNKNARDIADGRRPVADDCTVLPDLCIGAITTGTQALFSKDSATGTDASQQRHCAVSCDLETDSSDLEVDGKIVAIGELSESDLKKKHDEEEANVVTRYAHEIVSLEPMKEDIDDILHAHLLSMQALRDKQTREKEQIRQSLAQKRGRLLRRSECGQAKAVEGQGHDAGRISANQPIGKLVMFEGPGTRQTKMADQQTEYQGRSGYSRGQGSGNLYPQLHVNEWENRGHDEHVSRSSGKDREGRNEHVSRSSREEDVFKSSVEEMKLRLENGMNEDRELGCDRRNGGSNKDIDRTGVEVWMNGDTSRDDDESVPVDSSDMKPSGIHDREEMGDWVKQSSKQCYAMDDNNMKIEDIDDGLEEDNSVHDEEKPDHWEDLPTKTIRETTVDTGVGSDEIFKEKDESFICRLAREREILSDDDFANLLSKHLSDTECLRRLQNAEKQRLDDKMKAKLKGHENNSFKENSEAEEEDTIASKEILKLERKLQKRLLRKRDELDETDIQDIFKKFRVKQQKILERKEAEKEHSKEMLKQKLEQIRRQKNVKKSEVVTEDMEKEDELIEVRTGKQKPAIRQMEDSSVRESASSLVHEHQEDTRHINDLRKRERELMDERLKSRLNKKRL